MYIGVFGSVCRCPVLLVTGEKSVFNTTTRNLHKAIVKVCQNKSHVEFLEIPRVANVFEENPADVRKIRKHSNCTYSAIHKAAGLLATGKNTLQRLVSHSRLKGFFPFNGNSTWQSWEWLCRQLCESCC